jgi:hypothetical protein
MSDELIVSIHAPASYHQSSKSIDAELHVRVALSV